ncbi:MAG: MoaD/ThiS family protein [Candidatus Obscuribacterales bacterium]|nr:MoaD/ThiS family protein [Steroidobacteraceae bacterium]
MPCVVKVASPLRSYTSGAASINAEGHTVAAVLADLEQRFPGMRFRMIDEQDQMRRHIRIFVNTQEVKTLQHPVATNDDVHLICALSGG